MNAQFQIVEADTLATILRDLADIKRVTIAPQPEWVPVQAEDAVRAAIDKAVQDAAGRVNDG